MFPVILINSDMLNTSLGTEAFSWCGGHSPFHLFQMQRVLLAVCNGKAISFDCKPFNKNQVFEWGMIQILDQSRALVGKLFSNYNHRSSTQPYVREAMYQIWLFEK